MGAVLSSAVRCLGRYARIEVSDSKHNCRRLKRIPGYPSMTEFLHVTERNI